MMGKVRCGARSVAHGRRPRCSPATRAPRSCRSALLFAGGAIMLAFATRAPRTRQRSPRNGRGMNLGHGERLRARSHVTSAPDRHGSSDAAVRRARRAALRVRAVAEESLGDDCEEFGRLRGRIGIEKGRQTRRDVGAQSIEFVPEDLRPLLDRRARCRGQVRRPSSRPPCRGSARTRAAPRCARPASLVFDVLPRQDDAARIPRLARQHTLPSLTTPSSSWCVSGTMNGVG